MWDRMPGAVLTALWTVSHNIIITATPASPPPLANSDPTGPALLHICHGGSHAQLCWGEKEKPKEKKTQTLSNLSYCYPGFRNHGCLAERCGPAVSTKAFNLSNLCCWGGDYNSSWHSSQSARPWQPPDTSGKLSGVLLSLKWLRGKSPQNWVILFLKKPPTQHLWHVDLVQLHSNEFTSSRTFRILTYCVFPLLLSQVWRVHSWTVGGSRLRIANLWSLAVNWLSFGKYLTHYQW